MSFLWMARCAVGSDSGWRKMGNIAVGSDSGWREIGDMCCGLRQRLERDGWHVLWAQTAVGERWVECAVGSDRGWREMGEIS